MLTWFEGFRCTGTPDAIILGEESSALHELLVGDLVTGYDVGL